MKDMRKRHCQTSIFRSLPEGVHLLLLSYLPLDELVNFRAVSSYFKSLIDGNDALWANASLHKLWPTKKNILHMERASAKGNFEASLKLGITHLYSDSLRNNFSRRCSQAAARNFLRAEQAVSRGAPPFTWLFYRPPWVTVGKCRKVKVCQALRKMNTRHSQFCYAQLLNFSGSPINKEKYLKYMRNAERLGCPYAALKSLEAERSSDLDDINYLRKLRNLTLAHPGCGQAQMTLCAYYMEGKTAGLDLESTAAFTRNLFQSARAVIRQNFYDVRCFLGIADLVPISRFILMDWLTEVAWEKGYSEYLLCITAQIIDRYLLAVKTLCSSRIQLLGITALLLATRYLHENFLTIREATWLTDDAYRYDEVVKMMGSIVAVLKGRMTVLNCYDYLNLLTKAVPLSCKEATLAEYYCSVSLLYTEFTFFSPSETAAAAFLLAGIVNKRTDVWSEKLKKLTGFDIEQLVDPTLLHFTRCYILKKETILHSIYNTEEKHFVSILRCPTLGKIMEAFCLENMLHVYDTLATIVAQILKLNFQCNTGRASTENFHKVEWMSGPHSRLIHFLLGRCSKSLRATRKMVMRKCKYPAKISSCIDMASLFRKLDSRTPASRRRLSKGDCNNTSGRESMPLTERNSERPARVGWKRAIVDETSLKEMNANGPNGSKFLKFDVAN